MAIRHNVGMKPLAAALALALGASSVSADAGTSGNAAFAARMQSFRSAVTQVTQFRAQHPSQLKLMPNSTPHKLNQPQLLPSPPTPTKTVTSCVDDASSSTLPGTLRFEVINAVANDVIDLSFCNNSTITLTQGALPVTANNLTLTAGAPAKHVTIDGDKMDRVFYDTVAGSGSLTLKYLTVQNGVAPMSYNSNPVAVGGCILAPNEGVTLFYSKVTGCTAVNPTGDAEGGGLAAFGLAMYRSSITNNTVSAGNGTANNAAAAGGGAIAKYRSIIFDSQITGNTVTSNAGFLAEGGGLLASQPVLYRSTIANNQVHMIAGTGTTQPYFGVGAGLVAKYGGTLMASTISGNSATCTSPISGQRNAFCLGGGVVNAGNFGNSSNPPSQQPLEIKYSTISGNHSDFLAGGILSKYQLNLEQSTITGNSAQGGGGMMFKYGPQSTDSTAAVYNSTIAGNAADYVGGGIYNAVGPPVSPGSTQTPITLVSSIVAKNRGGGAPDDIYLSHLYTQTITGTNNLVMTVSSNITMPGATLSADPMLGPLAQNGGPTQTMGLYAGSPALNAGSNPNNYDFDQRLDGYPRVVGPAADIGAFEGTVAAPVPSPALSTWALGLLAGLLGWLGWRRMRPAPQRE